MGTAMLSRSRSTSRVHPPTSAGPSLTVKRSISVGLSIFEAFEKAHQWHGLAERDLSHALARAGRHGGGRLQRDVDELVGAPLPEHRDRASPRRPRLRELGLHERVAAAGVGDLDRDFAGAGFGAADVVRRHRQRIGLRRHCGERRASGTRRCSRRSGPPPIIQRSVISPTKAPSPRGSRAVSVSNSLATHGIVPRKIDRPVKYSPRHDDEHRNDAARRSGRLAASQSARGVGRRHRERRPRQGRGRPQARSTTTTGALASAKPATRRRVGRRNTAAPGSSPKACAS